MSEAFESYLFDDMQMWLLDAEKAIELDNLINLCAI